MELHSLEFGFQRKQNFSDDQILGLTAFGAGILITAAIFSMVIEAERSIGILATLLACGMLNRCLWYTCA